MAIKGMTFDRQIPLAAADAALNKVLAPDCRLYGCAVTYSGSTVTIGKGDMLLGGRIVRLTADETLTMTATTGTVYLIATVDTSAESTDEKFEQVSFAFSTSSDITQEAVNWTAGAKWQCIMATFTVTGGTISAASMNMGNAYEGTVIRASDYGDELPTTGLSEGRIFFKKL